LPPGVLLEVETVSVEARGVALLAVTADVLKAQLGAEVPPLTMPHERLTLPV
jgi:hypothetical protein